MDGISIFVIAVLFLALVTIFAGVKSVPQGREWTVERFGRFTRVLKPGLNLIFPYADRVGRKLSVMEEVLPVPSQVVITRDNATVNVDASPSIRWLMPRKPPTRWPISSPVSPISA